MKLWEQGHATASDVEHFTVGNDRHLDLELAPYDVLGSLAHVRMLEACGLLTASDAGMLRRALRALMSSIEAGEFRIDDGVEDVHSQVEFALTASCGEAGARVHTARSRNDQVLLDIKLYLRDRLRALVDEVAALAEALLDRAEEHRDVPLPGYTHLQVAMPSSFGLWFGAWAEALADDVMAVHAAYRLADRNPLGSAAGYGSSFPIDRDMTTALLGFEDMHVNAVNAQLARGKTERAAAEAFATVASTLGRFAMDVCLYTSGNFGFMELDRSFTTGSSIMPHKRNPDVFELLRAKCNRVQSVPHTITLITANLPSGYHRDMQILKDVLFPAFGDLLACVRIAREALAVLTVRGDILDDARYRHLHTVDAVHALVARGTPFRTAYRMIASEIEANTYTPPAEIIHTHIGSIGNPGIERIRERLRRECAAFPFDRRDAAFAALLTDED